MVHPCTKIDENSPQGFLRFCVNEVKIAYLDQVHWPLTFGESRPKSNQFIYSWWCIHVPSLMKIHPGVLEISRLKRGKINILRPSSLTFDLWSWADHAQNLISSSTSGGAPLYQVWWKSTQRFLRFRVNVVKIAYLDQVHWPLTLDRSRPKSNQFIYSQWCTPVPSLMKIHPGVFEISCKRGENSIFRPISLTFDPWRWMDLAQNLINSSTPGGAPLYQVWWKSTQGFLRFRVNEVKIAYLDQIHWPLTLDVGRISPKI